MPFLESAALQWALLTEHNERNEAVGASVIFDNAIGEGYLSVDRMAWRSYIGTASCGGNGFKHRLFQEDQHPIIALVGVPYS